MKNIFLLVFICYGYSVKAQQSVANLPNSIWTNYITPQGNFSVNLPQNKLVKDTLNSFSIFSDIDTLSRIVIIHKDSMQLNLNDPIFQYYSNNNTQDSISAIGISLVNITAATVDCSTNLYRNGTYVGKELCLRNTENGTEIIQFIRYYYFNNKIYIYVISGRTSNLVNWVAYKNNFLNSISIL